MSTKNDPWEVIKMLFFGLIVVFIMMLLSPGWASGNCNGPGDDDCYNEIVDVDVATGDMLGGDTAISTGGNKSLAVVAPGLGDVDIAQCLGSTQWSLLIGGKQKLVLNQVCMAEFYLKQGRYDLAAQALCNQPEILAEYAIEDDCEYDHDFTPSEPVKTPELMSLYDRAAQYDEDEEEHREQIDELTVQLQQQQQMIQQQQVQYQRIEERRPKVIQQYGLTDEKKAKLAEVLAQ